MKYTLDENTIFRPITISLVLETPEEVGYFHDVISAGVGHYEYVPEKNSEDIIEMYNTILIDTEVIAKEWDVKVSL